VRRDLLLFDEFAENRKIGIQNVTVQSIVPDQQHRPTAPNKESSESSLSSDRVFVELTPEYLLELIKDRT
jgi:hypothetical protein